MCRLFFGGMGGNKHVGTMKKRDFRKLGLAAPKYPRGEELVLGRREVVKSLGWFFGLSAVGVNLIACTDGNNDGNGNDDPYPSSEMGVAPIYDTDYGWHDEPDVGEDENENGDPYPSSEMGIAPEYESDHGWYDEPDVGGDMPDVDEDSDVLVDGTGPDYDYGDTDFDVENDAGEFDAEQ